VAARWAERAGAGAHVFLAARTNSFEVNARIACVDGPAIVRRALHLSGHRATACSGLLPLDADHLDPSVARDLQFGIDTWITFWKRHFSRQHLAELGHSAARLSSSHSRRKIYGKWIYVRETPAKGLVKDPDDGHFQGSFHPEVRW